LDWLRDVFRTDPHWSTFWATLAIACLIGLFKFVRDRHKEMMMFRAHVRKEETELWPGVKALHEQITRQHAVLLSKLQQHSVALKGQSVEIREMKRKMPNGEIHRIAEMLEYLTEKAGKGSSK